RALRERVPSLGQVSRAHGRVLWFAAGNPAADAFDDWLRAALPMRNDDGFLTAPGVFSHEHADPASRLLAEHLPPGLGGEGADLGAGWGWLAAAALARCKGIETLHLVEA